MQTSHHIHLKRVLLAWLAAPLALALADDLLNHIPADSAAVLVVRNPKATAAQIDDLGRKIARAVGEPSDEHFTVADMLGKMGIEPGWCDAKQPVALVLLQADLQQPRLVVGFTRAGRRFENLAQSDDSGTRIRPLREKSGSHGFGLRKGDLIFISTKGTALERIAGIAEDKSLAQSLSSERQKLCERSDIWVHGEVQPWIPRAEAALDQMVMFAKLMSTMRTTDGDASKAVFDWGLEGVKSVLHQMRSLDLALRFDNDGVTLTHFHEFTDGGSVSQFLSEGKQTRSELLAGLPDVPFLVATGSDWHGGESLQLSLLTRMSESATMKKNLKPADMEKLRRTLRDWNTDIKTSNFMLAVGRKQSLPVEMYATYECGDVKQSMERLSAMQCATQEMMDFLPGMGCPGQLEETEIDGVKAREVKMDFDRLNVQSRRGIEMMYGRKARFLMAPLGEHRLGYVLARRPEALTRLAKLPADRALTRNEHVRLIQSRLSPHPHMLCLLNLTQAVAMAPELAAAGSPAGMTPPMRSIRPQGTDALVGWSLVLEKNSARGDLYVSYDDVFHLLRSLRGMGHGGIEAQEPIQPREKRSEK